MLNGLRFRWRELWQRGRLDREAQAELDLHLELAAAAKVAEGLDPAEARRQARIELGDPEEARDVLREARTGQWLDTLARDAALGLRLMKKRPAFTAVSLVSIALGVAGSTSLFAVADAVVRKPLPLPDPSALVRIYDSNVAKGVQGSGVATANLVDWRRRVHRLRGIGGHYTMGRTLTVGEESEVVLTAQVTEDFFPLLGLPAAVGRTFTAEETARSVFNVAAAPTGADPVLVLADGLWRRRFGADPGVIGRIVLLERRPFRVVGVMPPGFAIPDPDVQVFIPWGLEGDEPRDQHYVSAVARLAPGATLRQAEEELEQVARGLAEEHPRTNEGWTASLVPLQDDIVGDSGRTLFALLGAVALVLLVACANLGVLSLARGLERAHETSIRLALGATRGRLLRQYFTESLLVCAAGGVLGAFFAGLALAVLKRTSAPVPRLHEVAFEPRAVLFALMATSVAALVAGLPSAWRRAHSEAAPTLSAAPARVAGGRRRHALQDALVVAEVATTVVLLASATLLVRSYHRLQSVDPGFDPRGVVVAPIFLDMEAYGSGDKSRAYYRTLIDRLEALPGVVSAGGATALPASPLGPDFERPVWPEESPSDESVRRPVWVRMVTTHYFRTLGMRIVAGRDFNEGDAPGADRTVILGQSLARRLWPSGNAVAHRLMVDYSTSGIYPYQVVGIVNDVRFGGPRSDPRLEIYLPHAQRPYLVMNIAVRGTGDPRLLIAPVREVLHEIDPRKPAHAMQALDDLVGATYSRDRHVMAVLSAFAVVAVLLSLLGVHAILLHRVRERTREIGIRIAVGADDARLLWWIAAHGLKLTLAGVMLGGLLAAASSRAVSALLFGVGLTDPAAILAVAALPLVALVVSLHPAWRATRIDAAEVLRAG